MKINWFSPLPPASTDIAHYTARVLPALSERASVTLWTDRTGWDTGLEKFARVRRYNSRRMNCWADIQRGDISIYHIGNNPLFHGATWQVSRGHSGVVVLHDFRLHHFFDGIYRVERRDLNQYLALMQFYYGEAGGRDALECFKTDARNIDYMAQEYPLTRLAIENALGVVVHTRDAFDDLRQDRACPVAHLPLPFAAPPRLTRADDSDKSVRRATDSPRRLIVFGYIGRNRRLDALLKALAQFDEREKFHLDVYGELLESKPVHALIRSLNLKQLVTLHGFVPEKELDAALAAAHLAINLRFPTMGEASGSQLRIWAHALPSLVTEVGWYAQLPADTVARVRPDYEIEDIQKRFRDFLSDPARFAKMGERGRRILEQEHAPELYAQAMLDFAVKAQGFRPHAASYKLAERAGRLMSDWLDAAKSGQAQTKVATEIYSLTHGSQRRK